MIAASSKEETSEKLNFKELIARNHLPRHPVILEKKKIKNFKPPTSAGKGSSSEDPSSMIPQAMLTSTYEKGHKVTSVAPLNLNPKLERLLMLNHAYKGQGSKLDTSVLDDTLSKSSKPLATTSRKHHQVPQDESNPTYDAINR